MSNPKENLKRAFHYALECERPLSKAILRELSDEELEQITVASSLLNMWAHLIIVERDNKECV